MIRTTCTRAITHALFALAATIQVAGCVARRDVRDTLPCASDLEAIAYSRVSLGPAVHDGLGYLRGPAARAVVENATEWTRLWKEIGDTIPRPNVHFDDSVLVVVASAESPTGPEHTEIEDVRLCRATGTALVLVRRHLRSAGYDYGDRSIRAVRLSRATLAGHPVAFVDLATDTIP